MIDLTRLFEAENGFKVIEGPIITGGANEPFGLDAEVKTFYYQETNSGFRFWQKVGPGPSAWQELYFYAGAYFSRFIRKFLFIPNNLGYAIANDSFIYIYKGNETKTVTSVFELKIPLDSELIVEQNNNKEVIYAVR